MSKINIFSIRFRIILLSTMGIVGMAVIAGTGWYLNRVAAVDQKIGENSQQIVRLMFQSTLKEEQFIKQPQDQLIEQHRDLQTRIGTLVSNILGLTGDQDVRSQSEAILAHVKTKSDAFDNVTEAAYAIRNINKEIFQKIGVIAEEMDQSVSQIDQEQAERTMEGEPPDPLKAELRVLLKEFSNFWKERLLTIQNLLLFGDAQGYANKKKKLDAELKIRVKIPPRPWGIHVRGH